MSALIKLLPWLLMGTTALGSIGATAGSTFIQSKKLDQDKIMWLLPMLMNSGDNNNLFMMMLLFPDLFSSFGLNVKSPTTNFQGFAPQTGYYGSSPSQQEAPSSTTTLPYWGHSNPFDAFSHSILGLLGIKGD